MTSRQRIDAGTDEGKGLLAVSEIWADIEGFEDGGFHGQGEDGELQGLVLPRDYGQREQNGVRSKQREDERFLCRQFWGWGGDGGGEG